MQADMLRHREPENSPHSITQALLRASKKDCNDSRNRFIPRAALANVISIELVAQLLQSIGRREEDAGHLRDMAQDICPNHGGCFCRHANCTGKRMFCAILLLCGREDLIPSLCLRQDPRICDNHLPLSSDSLDKINHDLSESEKELFIHMQWQVYTPLITEFNDENQTVDVFPDEVSLPWLSKERLGEPILGEWSHVDRIEIYPCSHNLTVDDVEVFALKTFEQRLAPELSQQIFQQEVDANLKAPKHDRVVRLLTAFAHREQFYLLFPFANEGSLEELWKSYTPNGINQNTMPNRVANWYSDEWLLSECLEITEALVATHGLVDNRPKDSNSLLHADIKPENILCFWNPDSRGEIMLKLADFGEAKQINSNVPLKASQVGHVLTYRPPEHFPDSLITLKYDVWCLGCLFLDFVTWAIVGQDGIDSFRKNREQEPENPAVTENPGQMTEDTFFRQDPGSLPTKTLRPRREKKLEVKNQLATTRYSVWVASQVKVTRRLKDAVISVSKIGKFSCDFIPLVLISS
ncbi:hypothetical protein FJTKL_10125 [Diaporthe vaccinii]|uniref:Protein kinase domain-containing protein n=1 Tax=Diaporthe vaccinii TaxID=105482 RepID=A0ABR4ELD7_9PEZI